jgi:AsmA-like C-terminal region
MSPARGFSWKWLLLLPVAFFALLFAIAAFVYFHPESTEDRIRQAVVQALSDRFDSDAELKTLHIHVFPVLHITGEDLVLRYRAQSDAPPLLQIEKFSFSAGPLGLLHSVKHIPRVRVENMVINVPPRGGNQGQAPTRHSQAPSFAHNIVVDQVECDHLIFRILPKQAGKEPLEWDIHNLVLTTAGANRPWAYHATLTNAKPKGEIATRGSFGPWDATDPGGTPVNGEYTFTDADLGPFPGISGILSSTGKYKGVLSELEVQGETDTPDFSLDRAGKPVPLHTDFSATVDGTNGDTYLHPVNATLEHSKIVAEGKVVRIPQKGHLISIDTTVSGGRIQDFLKLAINSDKPVLTGPVRIKAQLTIPPGPVHVIDKMILDGQFAVDDAKWSSASLREKLESLSRHAMGKPQDSEMGSAISDLNGNFILTDGVIRFRRLTFRVEGAAIDLAGTYAVKGGELDLAGHLRLQAKLSQTTTGAKSVLLKAVDPFFEKGGSGTVLPIHISGTRDNPVFGVTVFHKSFDKHLTKR